MSPMMQRRGVYPCVHLAGEFQTYDLRPAREPHFGFVYTESLVPLMSMTSV